MFNPSILIKALPIAGVDGTLENRMENLANSKRIHAKTGSMTGVDSLAGYIKTKHQGWVSFVIIINGIVGHRKPAHQLETKICETIIG